MKGVWIIKYKDGEAIYHYREEILDKDGSVIDYGMTKMFRTKQEAQTFLETLDSREFDRWIEEVL